MHSPNDNLTDNVALLRPRALRIRTAPNGLPLLLKFGKRGPAAPHQSNTDASDGIRTPDWPRTLVPGRGALKALLNDLQGMRNE